MARILITSGPTREYLDPVRYLTNASSGRMGAALAAAALEAGYEVVVVSGVVQVAYPARARVVPVTTTEEMLRACHDEFPSCEGVVGAAAPCDYRPLRVAAEKITKSGRPLKLILEETPDILTSLAAARQGQWMVAFALETAEGQRRATEKLRAKRCDLVVLNGPGAIDAAETRIEILDAAGERLVEFAGSKSGAARAVLAAVDRFLAPRAPTGQADADLPPC